VPVCEPHGERRAQVQHLLNEAYSFLLHVDGDEGEVIASEVTQESSNWLVVFEVPDAFLHLPGCPVSEGLGSKTVRLQALF
jgi:hypothetical protein